MHWTINPTKPEDVLLLSIAVSPLPQQFGQSCDHIPLYILTVAIGAGYRVYLSMGTEKEVNQAFYDNLAQIYHDDTRQLNLYQFFLTHMDDLIHISNLLFRYNQIVGQGKSNMAHRFVTDELLGHNLDLSIMIQ